MVKKGKRKECRHSMPSKIPSLSSFSQGDFSEVFFKHADPQYKNYFCYLFNTFTQVNKSNQTLKKYKILQTAVNKLIYCHLK